MRRILLMVLRNIFFVPVYWYKLCYHARHVDKYTEEEHYKLLKYIDHRANTSGNIHIEVHGQENIPEQDGFMFYPNHQGLYDVLAIMEACPRPFAGSSQKRSGRRTISQAGIHLYEGIHDRPRRCAPVTAGDRKCQQ